jgi:hypothetical protein
MQPTLAGAAPSGELYCGLSACERIESLTSVDRVKEGVSRAGQIRLLAWFKNDRPIIPP